MFVCTRGVMEVILQPRQSSTKTTRRESPQKVRELASTVVTDYWDDVMKFSKEPGLYTLGHPPADSPPSPHTCGATNHQLPEPLPDANDESGVRSLLRRAVTTRREQGDILPSLLARQCCEFYESLDLTGRYRFLTLLSRDFGVDRDELAGAAQAFMASHGHPNAEKSALRAETAMRQALRPLYERLFHQINMLPGGMQFLVHLRADIMKLLAQEGNNHLLRGLNDSLKTLLQGWFGMGFLELERITWNTSATVLEKIVRYEAVHAIPTWQSLKQRLGPGRLCYALFHRGMPQEPLTFVQVALTEDIADDVQVILNDSQPGLANPTTAVFYSISSSQRGLTGVDLGNFLIKRVVKEVQCTMPTVKRFITLSPIPRFRPWLETRMNMVIEGHVKEPLLLAEEEAALKSLAVGQSCGVQALKHLLNDFVSARVPQVTATLKPILLRLCSRYLLMEKKRHLALDPVANFHIRNGACVHRLNFDGDISPKGMEQSYGIMVNYAYVLDAVERNNQLYLLDGRISLPRLHRTWCGVLLHSCDLQELFFWP
ncbi:malonyl-CoA decarboxylase-domain-containing protein [Gaertneriomyces semiglobifer]|nr:malonyl-CoA decarboxylase-domain-containing protein [Gaertneriomyces semiglobifer]